MLYKKLLRVGLLIVFLVFFTKEVKAGSCHCEERLDGSVYLPEGGNNCEMGETAVCSGGTVGDGIWTPVGCDCKVFTTPTPTPIPPTPTPPCMCVDGPPNLFGVWGTVSEDNCDAIKNEKPFCTGGNNIIGVPTPLGCECRFVAPIPTPTLASGYRFDGR